MSNRVMLSGCSGKPQVTGLLIFWTCRGPGSRNIHQQKSLWSKWPCSALICSGAGWLRHLPLRLKLASRPGLRPPAWKELLIASEITADYFS